MPSAIPNPNDTTPEQVLPAKPYKGVTLQNDTLVNMYISWLGDDQVSNLPNNIHSGFKLEPGAIIDISDEFKGAQTANKSIWAIAEAGSGSGHELKYFVR